MAQRLEYRVDELAREAGTTVRNVRAYQDRGLLPSPRREGRVGLYSEAHLARLRLIGTLLERGYTLANIAELLAAWEQGQDIGALLGFEAALGAAWSDEPSVTVVPEDLTALFGDGPEGEEAVEQMIAMGLLEVEGDHYRAGNPRALEVGALLVRAGVPLQAILESGRRLRDDVDDIARQFVEMVDTHLFEPLGEPLPAAEVPRLAELLEQLRPLAKLVVDAELSRAMEQHIRDRFGAHLQRFALTLGDDEAGQAS